MSEDKELKETVDIIAKQMDQGFKEMRQNFSEMNQRIETMDRKFDDLKENMGIEFKAVRTEMDYGFKQVDKKIDGINERLQNVEHIVGQRWNIPDLTDRLESGILDLAITMSPLNSELLNGVPVFDENWVAMIPADHPLAKNRKKTVDIAELAGTDLIISSRRSRREEITGWFSKAGKKPQITVQIAHSSNAVHLVTRGIGIAIFPASVAKNISSESRVVIKKITPEVKVTYLLSWDKKRTPGVLAKRFIEHVKDSIV